MKIMSLLASVSLFAFVQTAKAADLPQNGTATRGTATITSTANKTTINQTTDRAVITWSEFNVGAGKTVEFKVPKHDSATLNKVTGLNPSTISGTIQTNGVVYLVNPNGLVFDLGAKVYAYRSYFTTVSIPENQFANNNGTKPDVDIVAGLTPNRDDSWLKLMVVCPCTALGTYDIIETQPTPRPKMEILATGEVKISNGADINIVYARGPSDADKSTAYSPATLTQEEKDDLPRANSNTNINNPPPAPNQLQITSSKLTIDNGSKVTGGTDAGKTVVLDYTGSQLILDHNSKVNLYTTNERFDYKFTKISMDNNSEALIDGSIYTGYLSDLSLDHGAKLQINGDGYYDNGLHVTNLTVKNDAQLTVIKIHYRPQYDAEGNTNTIGGKWDTDGGILKVDIMDLRLDTNNNYITTKPTFKIGVVKPNTASSVAVDITDASLTSRDLLNTKVKSIFVKPLTDPVKFTAANLVNPNAPNPITIFYDANALYNPSGNTIPAASCSAATLVFCNNAAGW